MQRELGRWERKAHLHISRIHPDTTTEEIKLHVASKGVENVEVEKLNSLHPQAYSSFKFTIPFDKLKIVNEASMWPCKTQILCFFFPRKQKSVVN